MGQRLLNLIENPVPVERPDVPEVLLHASGEQDTIHACIIAYANLYVKFLKMASTFKLKESFDPSTMLRTGVQGEMVGAQRAMGGGNAE